MFERTAAFKEVLSSMELLTTFTYHFKTGMRFPKFHTGKLKTETIYFAFTLIKSRNAPTDAVNRNKVSI
jgi:hypothetical protein